MPRLSFVYRPRAVVKCLAEKVGVYYVWWPWKCNTRPLRLLNVSIGIIDACSPLHLPRGFRLISSAVYELPYRIRWRYTRGKKRKEFSVQELAMVNIMCWNIYYYKRKFWPRLLTNFHVDKGQFCEAGNATRCVCEKWHLQLCQFWVVSSLAWLNLLVIVGYSEINPAIQFRLAIIRRFR